ncbi:hypothetical protein ACLK1T_28055 [Escherichia coli]
MLAEVRHPVLSSFVSLFPATTMLVAIGFVPGFAHWRCACSLWCRGSVGLCRLANCGIMARISPSKSYHAWTVLPDSCQQLYQRNGLWCVGLHRRRSRVRRRRFSWLALNR